MDNNAFKDLVRSYGQNNAGSSTKAIARKAVEEEFRKKKRKRSGDADSSDEEENNGYSKKFKRKQQQQQEEEEENKQEKDAAEAIQKDLASRYRDRAKERREGKVGDTTKAGADEATTTEGSNNILIVPHNIKGLDLALVRKERSALQSKSGGGNQKTSTAADDKGTTSTDENEGKGKIRDKLPSLEEAHEILQAFVSGNNKEKMTDNLEEYDVPTSLSSGLVEYLVEFFNWKTLDVSTWDEEPTGSGAAAHKSLQHTRFSLAIDGHPSDTLKAWQIPRQYTLSRGGTSGGSSEALLPIVLIHKIDAVFRKKNTIRNEMMERQTSKLVQSRTKAYGKEETQQAVAEKTDSFDDESDDDMFGGLDD